MCLLNKFFNFFKLKIVTILTTGCQSVRVGMATGNSLFLWCYIEQAKINKIFGHAVTEMLVTQYKIRNCCVKCHLILIPTLSAQVWLQPLITHIYVKQQFCLSKTVATQ